MLELSGTREITGPAPLMLPPSLFPSEETGLVTAKQEMGSSIVERGGGCGVGFRRHPCMEVRVSEG